MPRPKKNPETETAAKTKSAAKTPTEAIKRTVTRKAKPVVKTCVEYQGKQVAVDELAASIEAAWTGAAIKTLALYVKPEDGAVYYVVNDTEEGKVEF